MSVRKFHLVESGCMQTRSQALNQKRISVDVLRCESFCKHTSALMKHVCFIEH